ncbi:E motif [Dillenia turbinata]|uniref:E motif n=1 Tax=Dillenia turbinata TaxID=194707 RepID=A0AAN8UHN8_9MAGN
MPFNVNIVWLWNQVDQIRTHIIKVPNHKIFFNSILGHLTRSSTPQFVFPLYNQMLQNPNSHDHFTFTHALKACSLLNDFHKCLEIHAHVIKSGHYADIFIQNSILYFHVAIRNDIPAARQLFDEMPLPDVVSWTSIISGLCKFCRLEEALLTFSSMMHQHEDLDLESNAATLVSVISACCGLKATKLGKAVHGFILKSDYVSWHNIILENAMLDFYVSCGPLDGARYLFGTMPKRDVVSWTILVGGLAQRGFCQEAVKTFQDMVQLGEAMPNEATIVNALSACSSLGALSLGQWVHSYLSAREDLTVDGTIGNALINMYAKCGDIVMAITVFKMIKCKDIVSWSTIISGLAMNGHGVHAIQLFSLMLVHGIPLDDVTFLGLLSACSHGGLVDQGLLKTGSVAGGIYALLSNTYAISESWDDANKIRDEMKLMGMKKMGGYSWIEANP